MDEAKLKKWLIIIVAVGLVGLMTFAILTEWRRHSYTRPFEPMLEQYRGICETAARTPQSTNIPLTGKVVMISNIESENVRLLGWDFIPENLLARTPEEVGAIIYRRFAKPYEVGKYTDGSTAYAGGGFAICIVDVKSQRTIGIVAMAGTRPPSSKRGSGDRYGGNTAGPSDEELVAYLKQLAERPQPAVEPH